MALCRSVPECEVVELDRVMVGRLGEECVYPGWIVLGMKRFYGSDEERINRNAGDFRQCG